MAALRIAAILIGIVAGANARSERYAGVLQGRISPAAAAAAAAADVEAEQIAIGGRRTFWKIGHEYAYEYRGRLMSGFPELNKRHYVGLEIKAVVKMQVLDAERRAISLIDVKEATVNGELQAQSGDPNDISWRSLPIDENRFRPVSAEWKRQLAIPAIIQIGDSRKSIDAILVSADEADFSINLKKAIITQMVDYTAATSSGDEESGAIADALLRPLTSRRRGSEAEQEAEYEAQGSAAESAASADAAAIDAADRRRAAKKAVIRDALAIELRAIRQKRAEAERQLPAVIEAKRRSINHARRIRLSPAEADKEAATAGAEADAIRSEIARLDERELVVERKLRHAERVIAAIENGRGGRLAGEEGRLPGHIWMLADSVDGTCSTTFDAYPVPEAVAVERLTKLEHDACARRPTGAAPRMYEIIKVRDPSDCPYRSDNMHSSVGRKLKSSYDGSSTLRSRSVITRYSVCESREDPSHFIIDAVVNEEEVAVRLLGIAIEKGVSGVRQQMRLLHAKPIVEPMHEPKDALVLTSLAIKYSAEYGTYNEREEEAGRRDDLARWTAEYDTESGAAGAAAAGADEELSAAAAAAAAATRSGAAATSRRTNPASLAVERSETATDAVRHISRPSKPKMESLLPRIEKEMHELIDKDFVEVTNFASKQIPLKVLSVAQVLRQLSKAELEHVMNELDIKWGGSKVYADIMPEIVNMCGSVPCIELALDRIERDATSHHATRLTTRLSVWANLARVVRNPSERLLHALFERAVSAKTRELRIVHNHALLAVAQLMYKACISQSTLEAYPVEQRGRAYCHANSDVIKGQMLPYLIRRAMATEMRDEDAQAYKSMAIVALGVLGHADATSPLRTIIESPSAYHAEDWMVTRHRILALQALTRIGRHHQYRRNINRILTSVIANRAEAYEVRATALTVLLKTGPSMVDLQKIAMLSWSERDEEFLRSVNTALHSLAGMSQADVRPDRARLVRQIALIHAQIKRTEPVIGDGVSSSATWHNAYFPRLGAQTESVSHIIASRRSPIPQQIDYAVRFSLDEFDIEPLEMSIRLEKTDSIVDAALRTVGLLTTGTIADEPAWLKIKRALGLRLLDEAERRRKAATAAGAEKMIPIGPSAFTSIRIFEDTVLAHDCSDPKANRQLVDAVLRPSRRPRSPEAATNAPLSSQMVYDLVPSTVVIASQMGLPIRLERHVPVVYSFVGKAGIGGTDSSTAYSAYIEGDLNMQAQLYAHIGTVNPLRNEKLLTGLDSHVSFELPGKLEAKVDLRRRSLKLDVQMAKTGHYRIDLLHLHSRPFTVNIDAADLNPIMFNNNFSVIQSDTKNVHHDFHLMDGVTLRTTTQNELAPRHALLEKMKWFAYDPTNVLKLGMANLGMTNTGHLSLRNQQVTVRYESQKAAVDHFTLETELATHIHSKSKSKTRKSAAAAADQRWRSASIAATVASLLSPRAAEAAEELAASLAREKRQGRQPLPGAAESIAAEASPLIELVEAQGPSAEARGAADALEDVAQRLGPVERGAGVSIAVKARARGGHVDVGAGARVAAAFGQYKLRRKWSIKIESSRQRTATEVSAASAASDTSGSQWTEACWTGEISTAPVAPAVWQIDLIRANPNVVQFHNEIGYGRNCEEAMIKIKAVAQTSPEQREASRLSQEEQQLQKAAKMPLIASSPVAEKARKEASILDDWKVDIDTHNWRTATQAVKAAADYIQIQLLPYMDVKGLKLAAMNLIGAAPAPEGAAPAAAAVEAGHDESAIHVPAHLKIDAKRRRASLKIEMPDQAEPMRFDNIGLPYWMPMLYTAGKMAGKSLAEQAIEAATGQSLGARCEWEAKHIKTYDNLTLDALIDECDHLLTADCSEAQLFAVTARKVHYPTTAAVASPAAAVANAKPALALILPGTKIEMIPLPPPRGRLSRETHPVEIHVNGHQIAVDKSRPAPILDEQRREVGTAELADDAVIIVNTPYIRIKHDGHAHVELEVTSLLKGRTCGICGDSNNLKTADRKSPRGCALSSSLMLTSAYRLDGASRACRAQEAAVRDALRREEQTCMRETVIPAKLRPRAPHDAAAAIEAAGATETAAAVARATRPAEADYRDYDASQVASSSEEGEEEEVPAEENEALSEEELDAVAAERAARLPASRVSCLGYKHDVIVKRNGVACISKRPVSFCRPGCRAIGPRLRKEIDYACLQTARYGRGPYAYSYAPAFERPPHAPAAGEQQTDAAMAAVAATRPAVSARFAAHLIAEAEAGRPVPELRAAPTEFAARHRIPTACAPAA